MIAFNQNNWNSAVDPLGDILEFVKDKPELLRFIYNCIREKKKSNESLAN